MQTWRGLVKRLSVRWEAEQAHPKRGEGFYDCEDACGLTVLVGNSGKQ